MPLFSIYIRYLDVDVTPTLDFIYTDDSLIYIYSLDQRKHPSSFRCVCQRPGVILMPVPLNHHIIHCQVLLVFHPWSFPNLCTSLYLHLPRQPALLSGPLQKPPHWAPPAFSPPLHNPFSTRQPQKTMIMLIHPLLKHPVWPPTVLD